MDFVSRRLRVAVVDEDGRFREAVRKLLETDARLDLVASLVSLEDIIDAVWETRPHLVLLGVPSLRHGLPAVRAIRRVSSGTQVLLVTSCDDERELLQALKLGTKAVISRESACRTILDAIDTVWHGGVWLEPRHRPMLPPALFDPALPQAANRIALH